MTWGYHHFRKAPFVIVNNSVSTCTIPNSPSITRLTGKLRIAMLNQPWPLPYTRITWAQMARVLPRTAPRMDHGEEGKILVAPWQLCMWIVSDHGNTLKTLNLPCVDYLKHLKTSSSPSKWELWSSHWWTKPFFDVPHLLCWLGSCAASHHAGASKSTAATKNWGASFGKLSGQVPEFAIYHVGDSLRSSWAPWGNFWIQP